MTLVTYITGRIKFSMLNAGCNPMKLCIIKGFSEYVCLDPLNQCQYILQLNVVP